MDKNTILGLLLMGVVIFGFSMLNSGDDQSNLPTTEKTEKADAKQATTDIADSLNANELARIKTIVRQYGKQAGDNLQCKFHRRFRQPYRLGYDGRQYDRGSL